MSDLGAILPLRLEQAHVELGRRADELRLCRADRLRCDAELARAREAWALSANASAKVHSAELAERRLRAELSEAREARLRRREAELLQELRDLVQQCRVLAAALDDEQAAERRLQSWLEGLALDELLACCGPQRTQGQR